MPPGLVVLVVAVLATTALGLHRRRTDGRIRSIEGSSKLSLADLGAEPGARATLLQFSSAFCQPCRATRAVLAEVARLVPGVEHVEIDAESRLELVRRLGISRTPTVLVLDPAGRELRRVSGVPRKDAVLATLAELT